MKLLTKSTLRVAAIGIACIIGYYFGYYFGHPAGQSHGPKQVVDNNRLIYRPDPTPRPPVPPEVSQRLPYRRDIQIHQDGSMSVDVRRGHSHLIRVRASRNHPWWVTPSEFRLSFQGGRVRR